MITSFIITVIIFAFTIPCNSSEFRKDIDGWQKLSWGMTEENVLTAYKDQAERYDNPTKMSDVTVSIDIKKIKMGSYILYADCYFENQNKRLNAVVLHLDNNPSIKDFLLLEKMLLDKYGKPETLYKEKNKKYYVDLIRYRWNYPSSIIELTYSENAETIPYTLDLIIQDGKVKKKRTVTISFSRNNESMDNL
jgi:hypothetical protein